MACRGVPGFPARFLFTGNCIPLRFLAICAGSWPVSCWGSGCSYESVWCDVFWPQGGTAPPSSSGSVGGVSSSLPGAPRRIPTCLRLSRQGFLHAPLPWRSFVLWPSLSAFPQPSLGFCIHDVPSSPPPGLGGRCASVRSSHFPRAIILSSLAASPDIEVRAWFLRAPLTLPGGSSPAPPESSELPTGIWSPPRVWTRRLFFAVLLLAFIVPVIASYPSPARVPGPDAAVFLIPFVGAALGVGLLTWGLPFVSEHNY